MSNVRLEGVRKEFKDTVAVESLDLAVEPAEFFSLLGPSGCGKTTTLRMIGGFEEPTEGHIYLDGTDVTGVPPYKRDVNTVFQSYALFPHLDVHENVAYGLKRKRLPAQEIKNRVGQMLELVDLAGYERRRKNELSGGQQQRVALARALVNRPKVLLLDEPLGALDLKLRKQMQLELKRIQQEVGITFIYVTHDQEEAMTMSDRIGVMNAGRLDQVGAPEEVYEAPATAFVAGFLGVSNLLDGVVEARDSGMASVRLALGPTVVVPVTRTPDGAGPLRLGVRPEKLHLQRLSDGEPSDRNAVQARVVTSTYVGVSTAYGCEAADGSKIDVYVQNLSTSDRSVSVGEQVWLSWHPEHTFAVPADLERRP